MGKKKRKPISKPEKLSAKEILIGALIDLIVGFLLIIIDRMM